MSNMVNTEKSFFNISHLSLRALILGAVGSAVITASSTYVALRMGALPWPTVLAAIMSMALLKIFGKTTPNEVNITQTAMTAGAMVAGGLAFTLPGIWLEGNPSQQDLFMPVLLVSFAGITMGTVLTWVWRSKLLKRQNLPFPIGIAAAETIQAGDIGGKRAGYLFGSMGVAAIYTVIRDWFGKIPSYISFDALAGHNIFTGILMWPMAPAIGYMIGTLYSGVLFIGAVFAYFLLLPIGVATGIFVDVAAASTFRETLGLGLMVGSGLGVILSFALESLKNTKSGQTGMRNEHKPASSSKKLMIYTFVYALTLIFTLAAGIDLFSSILLMAGVFLATLMASLITGQAGINPMEIFAIIIFIAIRFILGLFSIQIDIISSLLIAGVIAVACGYAGDTLFDYKAGEILGTNPKAQLVAQVIGGIVGAVTATATIFVVINQYGPVGSQSLPAPQGLMVYSMVGGTYNPAVFWIAAAIGAILVLLKVPSITLGIGIYLSFGFSLAIFLGGLIQYIVKKLKKNKTGNNGLIIASGLFGGESLIGVLIPIIKMFTE